MIYVSTNCVGKLTNTTELVKNIAMSTSTPPSSANSDGGYAFQDENYQLAEEVHHSLINFKSGYENLMHANASSLLSFEQNERVSQNTKYLKAATHKDEYSPWEANQWNQISRRYNHVPRLMEDFNCFGTANNYGFMINNTAPENHRDWIYSEATMVTDCILEPGSQDSGGLKRPHKEECMQALKKQCTSTTSKKPKPKSVPSKDSQSTAAKNRRERISERLKILQELVPNGSKVDLVTMLEKAIGYVKFLQLQVKVLATDEFWPAPGGKNPDISQVLKAIDAILSSQKDGNSKLKVVGSL